MLVVCLILLFLSVAGCEAEVAAQYEYPEGDDDYYYSHYGEDTTTLGPGPDTGRVRRFHTTSTLRTLDAAEIEDVKGALQQIMSGRKMDDDLFTPQMSTAYTGSTQIPFYEFIEETFITEAYTQTFVPQRSQGQSFVPRRTERHRSKEPTIVPQRSEGLTFISQPMESPPWDAKSALRQTATAGHSIGSTSNTNTTDTNTTTTTSTTEPTTTAEPITTSEATTMTCPIQTTPSTRSTIRFDIEKFLEIIANLTYDYETNLTMQVNETLIRHKVPTCGTPTTTPEETTIAVHDYIEFNRSIIAKCFVCGLETTGIPYDADCADAFAGDFLPLVPQDPRAKGKIARFRKYCRWGDVHNYAINETQPRTIYGRWTGGCSVRWTDVSGVYSQRSCRNRRRAVTGKHFASKRMAKLEMALAHVDNGCIISPMATLLPLSRGVSLFSRFHACVCTGNWCNHTTKNTPGVSPLMELGGRILCSDGSPCDEKVAYHQAVYFLTSPDVQASIFVSIDKKGFPCFVCGLEATGIPYDADCADTFARDFPSLVPQDPLGKRRFRKYCRWGDVHNYAVNETQPRAVYGRWTGGCSVRWTDVSGVYSQRSCRNRHRAVTGKHFASRRMAKLEMTLAHVDDGCIVSPAASLLPLSRGVSLFARVHACVCTGNWCNHTTKNTPGVSPSMVSGWLVISALASLVQ